jgi:diaminohydroxyphosphoribosylaminopyrimidine deaminase/5-amino-6-(5-phosphoribosylamino)uracil reductase
VSDDEKYMSRCIQLAGNGMGHVAPNPMVGAVLVYNDRIIGEGYHQKYGEAHAEVNCLNSVREENKKLIEKSTMYVSLEPCSHYGKTPPCADLIIRNNIKKVIIGIRDINRKVNGTGIEKLRNAGVEVITGILEKECKELNKRFFTFHTLQRPYLILKWAQSADGKIGSANKERILISNEYSNRLVHKWRSEEAAILIGTHTALKDDPLLTTRLWKGGNPVRVVIDKDLALPSSLHIFNDEADTIIFNLVKDSVDKNVRFIRLAGKNFLQEMLHSLYENDIQSVLIEGGAKTLQSFIDTGLWDEARVITNEEMIIENGIAAPAMKNFLQTKHEIYSGNRIDFYKSKS